VKPSRVLASATLAVVSVACGSDDGAAGGSAAVVSTAGPTQTAPVIDPGDGGEYQVTIDPARFSSIVDNPYLPKLPGMRWEYLEVTSDGEFETITVEVLEQRRQVMGVETVIVRDVVTDAGGNVIEDTYDWFAQDAQGNVWYFGEDTTAFLDGVATKDGSWEGGVGGALPGIVMPGAPQVAASGYRQEFLPGEAEDMGQVIEVGAAVDVPAGSYDDVVRTRDWTPIEPEVVEHKAYAPGVGWVHESKTDEDGVFTIAVLTHFST
jgi:hypothetical protein